jgi:hypothetical protein
MPSEGVQALPPADIAHREALREAARALYLALEPCATKKADGGMGPRP